MIHGLRAKKVRIERAHFTMRNWNTVSCVQYHTYGQYFKLGTKLIADLRCGVANDNELLHLQCPFGMQISEIFFANFGTPQGSCGAFSNGTCSSPDAKDVISDLCLGENECQVVASSSVFGSACSDMQNRLAVQIGCQGTASVNAN